MNKQGFDIGPPGNRHRGSYHRNFGYLRMKYLPNENIKEEGGGAAVMAVGTNGFSNDSKAAGPVAGYDPIMKLRKGVQKKIKDRISPAIQPPSGKVPIGDCV